MWQVVSAITLLQSDFEDLASRRRAPSSKRAQQKVQLARHPKGFLQTDDPQGLIVGPAQADFRGHDLPVQAVLAFLALAAVAKISSDGL